MFTGSFLIGAVVWLLIRWIRANSTASLVTVGLAWLALTVAFALIIGRFVVGRSWENLSSDYKVWQGGLLPIGVLVLTLSPLIAAKLRDLARRSRPGV